MRCLQQAESVRSLPSDAGRRLCKALAWLVMFYLMCFPQRKSHKERHHQSGCSRRHVMLCIKAHTDVAKDAAAEMAPVVTSPANMPMLSVPTACCHSSQLTQPLQLAQPHCTSQTTMHKDLSTALLAPMPTNVPRL